MKTFKQIFIALLAILTVCSSLHAQYRWHIVQSDRIDSFFCSFGPISCSGENCSAIEELNDTTSGDVDSVVIIYSSDGGLKWNKVDSIPQWKYDSTGKSHLLFYDVQQIDSLDAIVVDYNEGVVVRTFDGWKTFRIDTSINDADFVGVDFDNAAEGILNEAYGFYLSTIDTGNHWTRVIFHGGTSCHSYGQGMFRVFKSPYSIYTTHDNWKTTDTTFITLSGPFLDTSLKPGALIFGGEDTLAVLCTRWDSVDSNFSVALVESTDLGAHWMELPVPLHNGITPSSANLPTLNWHYMALAGNDSLGRIVMSTNGGVTWRCDTVPLSNGEPYFNIPAVTVTGSGRVIAAIKSDSDGGSTFLAYLEPVSSSVNTPAVSTDNFAIFPNPATNEIQITSSEGNISISDPLGRSYEVKRSINTLDVSALHSGVYFISDGHTRAKFVKE